MVKPAARDLVNKSIHDHKARCTSPPLMSFAKRCDAGHLLRTLAGLRAAVPVFC